MSEVRKVTWRRENSVCCGNNRLGRHWLDAASAALY
jgi:hypothetical protein